MKKKNLWTGILSVVASGCLGLGVAFLTPTTALTANASGLQTVQSVYADFDMRTTAVSEDEAYYRSELSYYASGSATISDVGRYFDCNNYGVWEIPFSETGYETVQVDCSIKVVWRIYVAVAESGCGDINALTWTLGHEYTDIDNRYSEFQNVKADVTGLLKESTAENKSIYVKICDPTTEGGDGPQLRHMRVYVDKLLIETVHTDIPIRTTASSADEAYYRSDLSYYASGSATISNVGRYFDCNNYGVWEIPFSETEYEAVQVDCSIKVVWKIYVAVAESGCNDINALTWTLGHEYTDDNNRYKEFQNIKANVTGLLDASTAENKSIYVKICDPSTDAGNGPQLQRMRVYTYNYPTIGLTADATGGIPVGKTMSVFDVVNLKLDGITVTDLVVDIDDKTVLSYEDGKFTGLEQGTTSVTISYGEKTVVSEITVGGFVLTNSYQATTASELEIFRSDLSNGKINDISGRYFDGTAVGVWEIPLPATDYTFSALTLDMTAYWILEIGVGEPALSDLSSIAMTTVSKQVDSRSNRTDVRIVLSDYLSGDLSGKSLYVRASDPTTGDGNGPQIYKLTTLFRYARAPKAYGVEVAESMDVAIGENISVPVAVIAEPEAEYTVSFSVEDDTVAKVENNAVIGKKAGTTEVIVTMKGDDETVIATDTIAVTVDGYALNESFSVLDGKELPFMDGTASGYWREDISTRRATAPDKSMLDMLAGTGFAEGSFRYFDCEATGVWEFPFIDEAFVGLKLHIDFYVNYKIEIAVADTASYDADACEWVSADIDNWIEIAQGSKGTRSVSTFDVSEYLPENTEGKGLYVRISDPTTADGHGPKFFGMGVTYICDEIPQNFFHIALETSSTKMIVLEGEKKTVETFATTEDEVEYIYVYSIADESVATVSTSGRVTGVKAGKTTLTVSAVFSDGTVLASDEMEIIVTSVGAEVENADENTDPDSGCSGTIGGGIGVLGCLGACSVFLVRKRKENEK